MGPKQVNLFLFVLIACSLSGCSTVKSNMVDEWSLETFHEISKSSSVSKKYASLSNYQTVSPEKTGAVVGMNSISDELSRLGARNIQRLDLGVYAKIGSRVVFVADRKVVSDYDRLYWVMVKILSEKYGCFITRKIDMGEQVYFRCRDRRTVAMLRRLSGNFAVLQSRQYDSSGVEIQIADVKR